VLLLMIVNSLFSIVQQIYTMLQMSTKDARYLRRFIQTYRCFIIVDLRGGRRWLPLFSFNVIFF
jgi:membrane protein insertase Oxa1/YidC/SpoIIIJ